MTVVKTITLVTGAIFFWSLWDASTLGFYVGSYPAGADHQPQCRYITARGLFDEVKSDAVAHRSTSTQYCPSTSILSRSRDAQRKHARF